MAKNIERTFRTEIDRSMQQSSLVPYSFGSEINKPLAKMSAELFQPVSQCIFDIAANHSVDRNLLNNQYVEQEATAVLAPLIAPYQLYDQKDKLIKEVLKDDIPSVAALAYREFLEPGFMSHIAVRTVFGTDKEVPVGYLSYLLPSLDLLQAMKNSNKFSRLPQVQFVFMTETGIQLNGYEDSARQNALQAIELADKFIQTYFADIAANVVFANDRNFVSNPFVQQLVTTLETNDSVRQDPDFMKIQEGLINGERTNSHQYMLRHPLAHDLGYEEEVFTTIHGENFNNNPAAIINIGGQMEKQFTKVRQIVSVALDSVKNNKLQTIQLFTAHKSPPYQMKKEGTKTISDLTLTHFQEDPLLFDTLYNGLQTTSLRPNEFIGADLMSVVKRIGGIEPLLDLLSSL